jgi:hypothetical protein
MPTFAFPTTPPYLAVQLQRNWNAPLPLVLLQIHSFGGVFMPDYYPCPIARLVSCYALVK